MTDTTIIENDNATANNFNIDERAQRIRSMLQKSTTLWLEIAQEVSNAKKSLNNTDFELFLTKSALSTPIADKLLSIAKATILYFDESKAYLDKLDGWTTLYEVAKLSEADIRDMYRELDRNPDQPLTRSYIKQFKSKKTNAQRSDVCVATVMLSEDQLIRLDYNEFCKFKDDINSANRIIDRSIIAARMNINSNALERLEALIVNAATVDHETETDTSCATTTLFPSHAANNSCSVI